MSYFKDFQTHISNHNYAGVLRLWEEYCAGDDVDAEELQDILRAIKVSGMSESFGRHVERILPLWQKLPEDVPLRYEILKLIIDIQTTNSEALFQLAMDAMQKRCGEQKNLADKLRLIGMRSKEQLQGALSRYELLHHMHKGKFVFHTGGWGVGEILDVSLIREQLSIEFDHVPGKKDMSFANAFKALIPIPDDHFLALRFGSPDTLERQAKEDPAHVIRILLRDLGPKSAGEIKDELIDLVIPANEWTRWWQLTRTKIKKDTMIQTPDELKDPFVLRKREMTHEERLQKVIDDKSDPDALIQTLYSFMKDFAETLKKETFRTQLSAKATEMLSCKGLSTAQELQVLFFLEDLGAGKGGRAAAELIGRLKDISETMQGIQILAFKKRLLVEVRKARPDWKEIFLDLFLKVDQASLRDYLLQEFCQAHVGDTFTKKLEELLVHPHRHPDAFLWYFQKAIAQSDLPFGDKPGRIRLFEAFLILLSLIEQEVEHRDLVKKMHALLSAGRYAIVRQIMQEATLEDVKEFLLLSTKCHSMDDHEIKILHSLAEVAHPSLGKQQKKQESHHVIWTSQEGFLSLQKKIQQIATVETVQNAKEIEVARSHGDLRENAEFKAALEKRSRLQSELKQLSDQLNRSRVLTKQDISTEEVGVGCIVDCKTKGGQSATYTLLGPWDANTEKHILSLQSKLAQAMSGLRVGSTFQFQGEEYTITAIRSFL